MKKASVFAIALIITLACFAQRPSFTVVKKGKGKPVLFLPGFSTPGSVWNESVQHIKGNVQAHLFTYAGFGGVTPIDTPWYTSIRRDLMSYILEHKLLHITVIGHSMGGTLAMDIAAALPNKVDRIILVDALPAIRDLIMPGVSADKIHYNTPHNNQMLQMKEEAFEKNAVMMAAGMTSNKEKADSIANWIITTDRKTYVYGFTDLLKLDLRDDLKKIKARALILGATFPTKDVAKRTFEQQYSNLKHNRIEMAPESKHYIMFDQPDWFYAQLNAFLK